MNISSVLPLQSMGNVLFGASRCTTERCRVCPDSGEFIFESCFGLSGDKDTERTGNIRRGKADDSKASRRPVSRRSGDTEPTGDMSNLRGDRVGENGREWRVSRRLRDDDVRSRNVGERERKGDGVGERERSGDLPGRDLDGLRRGGEQDSRSSRMRADSLWITSLVFHTMS